jgi:hypothetical protein
MEQEAPDELGRVQRHRLLPVMMPIVLPAEADLPLREVEEAVIGYGHAMGVPPEILQDLRRPAEGRLGVDHPLGRAEGHQSPREGGGVLEGRERAGEVELAVRVRRLQLREEQPSEQPREHAHREEEPRPTADPALAIGGQAPARDHAVEMGVMA